MDTRILNLKLELPVNTAILQVEPQDWQGANVNLDEFTIDVAGMWEAEDKAKKEPTPTLNDMVPANAQLEMTFDQALETALKEVKDSYAQSYLRSWHLRAVPQQATQLEYALANMQHYRGKTARQVKRVFKAKIAELEAK